MTDVLEIANLPTTFTVKGVSIVTDASGYHESVLRAYQIVRKVKALLELGTPSSVILEMIAVMESVQYPDTTDFVIEVETFEQKMQRSLEAIREKQS